MYKPLTRDELYMRYPDKVSIFKGFEAKITNVVVHDKEWFNQHQQDLLEQPEIKAKKKVPKI